MTSLNRALLRQHWLFALLLLLTILLPFGIYAQTLQTLLTIWHNSETFAHGYIILPISLWLIWQRRETLLQLKPRPCWWALPLLALCGVAWLLADLAEVWVVAQYAFVSMLPLVVLAFLGRTIAWAIAFPLAFLLLMVPFGEVFIDPLIQFTADFTVNAVRLTGIPIVRDGNHFSLPSGNWAVIEACSGIRYLIASFTLGTLYAYLTYRSRVKQTIFIVLSVIVPVVANGLRAFMIVMIGHFSGMKYAVGVDHLIYGWVFFGFVMLIFFWIGNRWREDHLPIDDLAQQSASMSALSVAPKQFLLMTGCIATILLAAPLYANYLQQAVYSQSISLSSFSSAWQESSANHRWYPSFRGATAELTRHYRQNDQSVGIFIRYYRQQQEGAKLISSSNKLASEETEWHKITSQLLQEQVAGKQLAIRETTIRDGDQSLLVWQFYWIYGEYVANDYLGKWLQVKNMLAMRGDDGAALLFSSTYTDNPEQARIVLRRFLSDNLNNIETLLNQQVSNK